jgi:hypothetical protein
MANPVLRKDSIESVYFLIIYLEKANFVDEVTHFSDDL